MVAVVVVGCPGASRCVTRGGGIVGGSVVHGVFASFAVAVVGSDLEAAFAVAFFGVGTVRFTFAAC